MERRYLPIWFYFGIVVEIFLFVSAALGIRDILIWATPIFWTGYILILDGIVFGFNGYSTIFSLKFIVLLLISVIAWLFFEWMNIFLSNWHYKNLVENVIIKYIGYFWSFATIFPGVLFTFCVLLIAFREFKFEWKSVKFKSYQIVLMILTGFVFLILPIVQFSLRFVDRAADRDLFLWLSWFSDERYSGYMAAFVWLSIFLILDPINYLMKRPSILGYAEKGNYKILVLLSLSGLICGILWETVNSFAFTKWYYTVPILGYIKVFEMPILGYLGFIPFAWEIYSITSFLFKPIIEHLQKYFLPNL